MNGDNMESILFFLKFGDTYLVGKISSFCHSVLSRLIGFFRNLVGIFKMGQVANLTIEHDENGELILPSSTKYVPICSVRTRPSKLRRFARRRRSGDTWRPDYDTGIGFSRSNSRSIWDDGYCDYYARDYYARDSYMDNSRAGGPGFYGSFSEAAANGAFCGPSSGGAGFYC